MKKYIYVIIMGIFFVNIQHVFAQDANEIVKRLEANRVFDGLYSEGSITVDDKYGIRVTEYISKDLGTDNSIIEYTSAAEKGQKILRVKDKIYLYFPDSEEIQTLNKSMFQQGVLDSDISYEDISGDKSLLQTFTAELEKEEKKNGIDAYVIYLSAIKERKEVYPYQRLWINKENYSLVAAEYFTRKKKLRKVITINKVEEIKKSVFMAIDITYKDVLKKGNGTRIQVKNIEFKKYNKSDFSVESLKF